MKDKNEKVNDFFFFFEKILFWTFWDSISNWRNHLNFFPIFSLMFPKYFQSSKILLKQYFCNFDQFHSYLSSICQHRSWFCTTNHFLVTCSCLQDKTKRETGFECIDRIFKFHTWSRSYQTYFLRYMINALFLHNIHIFSYATTHSHA